MEDHYRLFSSYDKENFKINYFELGIFGCELLFLSNCSILSMIDFCELSFLLIRVKEILVIINKKARTVVNLVKKLPADLDDIRLSLFPPIPKAPPSDFWSNTDPIRRMAKVI